MMMIYFTPVPGHGFIVETSDPINGKKQRKEMPTEGDALRLAHTWNRQYIIEVMLRWLHQRIVALRLAQFYKQELLAYGLLDKITNAAGYSTNQLYRLILINRDAIKAIAPGEKSRQYGFYNRVVLSIIEFCQNNIKQEYDN